MKKVRDFYNIDLQAVIQKCTIGGLEEVFARSHFLNSL